MSHDCFAHDWCPARTILAPSPAPACLLGCAAESEAWEDFQRAPDAFRAGLEGRGGPARGQGLRLLKGVPSPAPSPARAPNSALREGTERSAAWRVALAGGRSLHMLLLSGNWSERPCGFERRACCW